MPRVIISSGHTSLSPGSIANGLKEYDVARKIAKATVPHLRQNGVIALTVPPDTDLASRIEWINSSGYKEENDDVAIEIHINDGGKSGIEVWYEGDGNNKSKRLADLLLTETTSSSGLPAEGAKSEYEHELGSLAFLHDTEAVTCLIECGYIDNDNDAKFLKEDSNLDKLGKGIAKGILKFLNIEYKESPAPASIPVTPQASVKPVAPKVPAAIPPRPTIPAVRPISNPAPVAPIAPKPASLPDFDDDFDDFGSGMGGFSGPSNFNQGGGFGAPSRPQAAGGMMPPMPSREERREMIKNNYIKILGREPNQNDLNYFLNIGITEDQLLKKMIDSQEHADLVKARQEVLVTKKKFTDQQQELASLRAEVSDQRRIIENYHASIQQKNMALAQVNANLHQMHQNAIAAEKPATQSEKTKYKGTFLDKLFKAFSDIFT